MFNDCLNQRIRWVCASSGLFDARGGGGGGGETAINVWVSPVSVFCQWVPSVWIGSPWFLKLSSRGYGVCRMMFYHRVYLRIRSDCISSGLLSAEKKKKKTNQNTHHSLGCPAVDFFVKSRRFDFRKSLVLKSSSPVDVVFRCIQWLC